MLMWFWSKISRMFLCMFLGMIILRLKKCVFYICTGFFSLGSVTSLGEENSDFKPVKLHLKIDLVSHPAYTKEFINTYIYNAQKSF